MNASDPIRPGKVLVEQFLGPHDITQHALALRIGVPPRRINEIVHGKRSITPDTALRLSRIFETTPEYWIALQTDLDLTTVKESMTEVLDAIEPLPASPEQRRSGRDTDLQPQDVLLQRINALSDALDKAEEDTEKMIDRQFALVSAKYDAEHALCTMFLTGDNLDEYNALRERLQSFFSGQKVDNTGEEYSQLTQRYDELLEHAKESENAQQFIPVLDIVERDIDALSQQIDDESARQQSIRTDQLEPLETHYKELTDIPEWGSADALQGLSFDAYCVFAGSNINPRYGARILWGETKSWRGDTCGCTDDRCIGYHHDENQDCLCVERVLEELHDTLIDSFPK